MSSLETVPSSVLLTLAQCFSSMQSCGNVSLAMQLQEHVLAYIRLLILKLVPCISEQVPNQVNGWRTDAMLQCDCHSVQGASHQGIVAECAAALAARAQHVSHRLRIAAELVNQAQRIPCLPQAPFSQGHSQLSAMTGVLSAVHQAPYRVRQCNVAGHRPGLMSATKKATDTCGVYGFAYLASGKEQACQLQLLVHLLCILQGFLWGAESENGRGGAQTVLWASIGLTLIE